MEWVETTAKTLDEAKELALDRLGVAADEAEFEVLEEPRAGLFGRVRGEARVRARVMPTAVRPKQDRRGRGRQRDTKGKSRSGDGRRRTTADGPTDETTDDTTDDAGDDTTDDAGDDTNHDDVTGVGSSRAAPSGRSGAEARESTPARSPRQPKQQKEQQVNRNEADQSQVAPAEVGAAAEEFMTGLVEAFGLTATTEVTIDGSDIEVQVNGDGLGLMVGHGGRTLMAVQDLARVASQRRLGDHETRLRVDVGGYRAKRGEALARFAVAVAEDVVASGTPKALEPMQSADRKIVHDALAGVEGVTSRSEGDDPMRRIIISPA